MTIGVVGRKVGMTRVFTEDGDSKIPPYNLKIVLPIMEMVGF